MKQFILFVLVVILSSASFAQKQPMGVKKGHKAFENYSYERAIRYYKGYEDDFLEVKRKLAISLWKLNRVEEAEEYFKQIAYDEAHIPEDLFHYASLLRVNEKYGESEVWMRKYGNEVEGDSRTDMHIKERGSYRRLESINKNYKIKNLKINSSGQDFAATFYKKKVVFVSSREGTKPIQRRWNWNRLPFLDIYVAEKDEEHELGTPIFLSESINRKLHEGPVAFSHDGNLMIFTRNSYEGKSAEGYTRLQLFSSYYQDGQWGTPQPLPFNSTEYSVGHAALSHDGKTLFFASNMPGGFGGVDLYRAEINDKGVYGEAVNMGERVNTEGDEMFPFIHENGEMLFFSSNGRVGLGGQDVFLAQIKPDQTVGKVTNLGAPVNGRSDDFAFVLNEEQTSGYFSSNREGGKGNDDIYAFDLKRPYSFRVKLKGVAKNADGELLANTTVTLFDLFSGDEDVVRTDENGAFEFNVEQDKTFNIRGKKQAYFDGLNVADTHTEAPEITVNLTLEDNPAIALYMMITDNFTGTPLNKVNLKIKDNQTGQIDSTLTPFSGDFLKTLTEKRVGDNGSYEIEIEKEGYLSKTITYNLAFTHDGLYAVHDTIDLAMDSVAVGRDLSAIININPIYFDVGKALIRPDAAIELDKIVKVMNENPTMEIELGSHTDSRGTKSSNLFLSDKRAKASAAYIAARISNPERISGRGYGEYTPNTVDASADGGESSQNLTEEFINTFKDTNEELFNKYHQMNRRTELIILKM